MTAFFAFQMFLALAVGHYVGDFALQTEYMSKAKSRTNPLAGTPWFHALAAHCAIHGGLVWALTGNVWLGLAEGCVHAAIDDVKCAKRLTYSQDQALHLSCKALWTALIYSGIASSPWADSILFG